MKKITIEILTILFAAVSLILAFPKGEKLMSFLPDWRWELLAYCAFVPIFVLVRDKNTDLFLVSGICLDFSFFMGHCHGLW